MVPLFSAVLDNCSSLICRPNPFCGREDSKFILLVFLARLEWYVCFYPIFSLFSSWMTIVISLFPPFWMTDNKQRMMVVGTTDDGGWNIRMDFRNITDDHRVAWWSFFVLTTHRWSSPVLGTMWCVCDSRNKGTKPSSWSSSSCHKNVTRLNLQAIYTRTLRKPIQSE